MSDFNTTISFDVFSVSLSFVDEGTLVVIKQYVDEQLDSKQDTLIAGDNITIVGNVISSTGGGSVEHDDTLNKNGNPDFLHITQAEKDDFVTASDFVEDFISNATGILYADLLDLIDNNELIPSSSYRITNYTTTTVQADTTSAGHDFDVIVTALSTNELSENAKCVKKAGDTYFENAKLEAWEIKYCIDNDTSRFAWADTVNGKGVIYYMKDEWNNECAYDFKNIQFKYTDNLYYYTFSAFENTLEEINDASLMKYRAADDDPNGMTNNNIKPAYTYLEDGDNWLTHQRLNNIIFKSYYDEENFGIYLPSNNSFGVGCYDIFFDGTEFTKSNKFGDDCFSNKFGNNFLFNTFGDYCNSNTFGNACNSNTFGNACNSNTFGNYCNYNTFGNACNSNTLGNYCNFNTFGNECGSNNFYVGTSGTTKKDYIRYIVLEDGCRFNNFYSALTTNGTSFLQRIRIKGLDNTTPTDIQITLSAVNTKYEWVICYTSGGTLKQYCPDNNDTYKIEDTSVSTWAASIKYVDFAFESQINIADLRESDFVNVVFGVNEANSGNYAAAIEQYAGYILVFSKVNTAITIPTISVTKIDL
jgi:hypothetical protein